MLRRRVAQEIADRSDTLPVWLAELQETVGGPEAVEVSEPFGDGADVMASVTLPGGHTLVAVVLVEHNLGSIVKDAFVVPGPVDELVAALDAAKGRSGPGRRAALPGGREGASELFDELGEYDDDPETVAGEVILQLGVGGLDPPPL